MGLLLNADVQVAEMDAEMIPVTRHVVERFRVGGGQREVARPEFVFMRADAQPAFVVVLVQGDGIRRAVDVAATFFQHGVATGGDDLGPVQHGPQKQGTRKAAMLIE